MTDWIELLSPELAHTLDEEPDPVWAGPRAQQDAHTDRPNPASTLIPDLLPAAAFLASWRPPDWLLDGIIQRGYLYALTAPTGHGKTATALLIACMVSAGRHLGPLRVSQGTVVFLAGENPADLCGRVHAAVEKYGLDPAMLPIYFLPATFPMTTEAASALREKINVLGNTALIIADSAASFFSGDAENDNAQQGAYARTLRTLTGCTGNPAVLMLCHPTKGATKDNLLPRGGGAFIAEIDGNLTQWSEGDRTSTELHWSGKIRGANFEPIRFNLSQVRMDHLQDTWGRPAVTVIATYQTPNDAMRAEERSVSDDRQVLEHLSREPGMGLRVLCRAIGWTFLSGDDDTKKADRVLKRLEAGKMVVKEGHGWRLTKPNFRLEFYIKR